VTRPERAYLPEVLERGRAWGFGANLYALRSSRNWGVGDFTDLADLVRLAASLGAATVGVNPLHALHYVDPEAASPYSPTSRYFRNPIYIDVEAVPEFRSTQPKAVALRERVASTPFALALDGLRRAPNVDYARVARAKWSAFEELYAVLREARGDRLATFRAFVERGGDRLERFAVYEALTENFASDEGRIRGWLTWDEAYRDAASPAVRAWAAKNRRRVEYFKYLQFIADEQLADVAVAARALAIGLYLDVAVGVDINSADVWSDPSAYVLDETIGAPPDPLGPSGQNWGLPPLDPAAMLRESGASFTTLLAANMAHAGALRLDHVMALMRLFRIPRGKIAAEGAYVAYPFDDLVALATSESVRARCLIVGEDLGTVPGGFRERMAREAILSYRLLLFERDDDGAFRSPDRYPDLALATGTTHDVPTLVGWLAARDVATRERIGLVGPEEAEAARRARRVDASRLLEAFARHGELEPDALEAMHRTLDANAGDAAAYEPLVRAAYRYLASSPAKLVLIQLDDATLEFEQVNVPGTFVEYPNWRRKSGLELDAIANDALIAALASDVDTRVKRGSPS
jgi:4-alpha-glucanotransferase